MGLQQRFSCSSTRPGMTCRACSLSVGSSCRPAAQTCQKSCAGGKRSRPLEGHVSCPTGQTQESFANGSQTSLWSGGQSRQNSLPEGASLCGASDMCGAVHQPPPGTKVFVAAQLDWVFMCSGLGAPPRSSVDAKGLNWEGCQCLAMLHNVRQSDAEHWQCRPAHGELCLLVAVFWRPETAS